MQSLVAGGVLGGFVGAIVTMILAFCLKSGRRFALAAYAIFALETGFLAAMALLSEGARGIVPLLVFVPILLLLGTLAYVNRPIRQLTPHGVFGGGVDCPWPPGGGNPFGGDKPTNS